MANPRTKGARRAPARPRLDTRLDAKVELAAVVAGTAGDLPLPRIDPMRLAAVPVPAQLPPDVQALMAAQRRRRTEPEPEPEFDPLDCYRTN